MADDLFLYNSTSTLPKATDMSGDKILADGKEITGWFYDGWYKWNTEKMTGMLSRVGEKK